MQLRANQGNSCNARKSHHKQIPTLKQTIQLKFPRTCDKIYSLKSPLQIYTGLHAPTQLHIALQHLHCKTWTATIALHTCITLLLHTYCQTKIAHNTCRSAPMLLNLLLLFVCLLCEICEECHVSYYSTTRIFHLAGELSDPYQAMSSQPSQKNQQLLRHGPRCHMCILYPSSALFEIVFCCKQCNVTGAVLRSASCEEQPRRSSSGSGRYLGEKGRTSSTLAADTNSIGPELVPRWEFSLSLFHLPSSNFCRPQLCLQC